MRCLRSQSCTAALRLPPSSRRSSNSRRADPSGVPEAGAPTILHEVRSPTYAALSPGRTHSANRLHAYPSAHLVVRLIVLPARHMDRGEANVDDGMPSSRTRKRRNGAFGDGSDAKRQRLMLVSAESVDRADPSLAAAGCSKCRSFLPQSHELARSEAGGRGGRSGTARPPRALRPQPGQAGRPPRIVPTSSGTCLAAAPHAGTRRMGRPRSRASERSLPSYRTPLLRLAQLPGATTHQCPHLPSSEPTLTPTHTSRLRAGAAGCC